MSDPEKRSHFDLTINLGHVLVLAGALAGIIGSHYVGDYRQVAIERKADAIETKLDRLSVLLVDGAVIAQRMKEFERRLDLVERR